MPGSSRVLLLLFLSINLWGCSKADTELLYPETAAVQSEADKTKAAESLKQPGGSLPLFQYSGVDPYERAACEYFVSIAAHKEPDWLYIPAPNILKTEKIGNQVFVYGSFYDFWYSQEDTILFCKRGGENTGRLCMEMAEGALQVTGFEQVRDGGDYAEDWERLCGDDRELYEALFDREIHEGKREKIRKELISQYVQDHDLAITSYQDYGWEPVKLFAE